MAETILPRYFIDERVGCLAVMDRTAVDPDGRHGLDPDISGVVKFWQGETVKLPDCPLCNHSRGGQWSIPESIKKEAKELCDQLNSEEINDGEK